MEEKNKDKKGMEEKQRKTVNMLTLAFAIAFMPPIWAVLAPFIGVGTGSVALICAGIGTLIFHFCTGNRVPVFVGSSFAYIAALQVIIARYSEGDNNIPGIQAAQGGIIAAGFVYCVLALIVKLSASNE